MIDPAPTTKLDPTLARGTVVEVLDATDSSPAKVVLSFPNNSYKGSFDTADDLAVLRAKIGEIVIGRISAKARKMVRPLAGGRKIDPCFGTPQRVMGTVIGVDPVAKVLVMDTGAPMIVELTALDQRASDFADAEFLACDVLPGTSFAMQMTD
jgi:hypothetical protein